MLKGRKNGKESVKGLVRRIVAETIMMIIAVIETDIEIEITVKAHPIMMIGLEDHKTGKPAKDRLRRDRLAKTLTMITRLVSKRTVEITEKSLSMTRTIKMIEIAMIVSMSQ